MAYVIKRLPDGAYVAPKGSPRSYVRALQCARTFPTKESAEWERCPGNEVVVPADGEITDSRRWR